MSGRILQNSNIIEVRQGDSFVINLQFNKSCKEIDLSGSYIKMQVRNMYDGKIVIDKLASEVDTLKGKFAIILTPDDTNIKVDDYYTDIQITTADGSVNTFFPADVNKRGIFRVTEQVTR